MTPNTNDPITNYAEELQRRTVIELIESRPVVPIDPAQSSNASLYVWAVIGLSVVAVVAILVIFLIRPDRDNTSLITIVLGFLVPVIMAFLAASIQQVHLAVNSRLSQLVALTAKASRAEGELSGSAIIMPDPIIAAIAAKKVIDDAATAAAERLNAAAIAAEKVMTDAANRLIEGLKHR